MGLEVLPGAGKARNVVLPDDKVLEFVARAYARDEKLGLLLDTLAVTGARPSQAVRARVEDLGDDPTAPKIMMPKSGKGGGRNRSDKKSERYPLPITAQFAAKLVQAARGRPPAAPLLTRADGQAWNEEPNQDYRDSVRELVAGIGLDPDVVTVYALRHTNITRMLLRKVPVRLVASLHDTSVGMIERNYSRYIVEHGDEHARAGLLENLAPTPPPAYSNQSKRPESVNGCRSAKSRERDARRVGECW